MKLRNILILGLLFSIILYPQKQNGDRIAWANSTDTHLFKAITYNIHGGKSLDGKSSLNRIENVLKKEQADFIALQEVDRLRPSSGFEDQINYLANKLGMEFIFTPTIKNGFSMYGNGILSRYPILSSGKLELSGGREPRILVWAKVYTEKGSLYLTSVHLDTDITARPFHLAKIQAFLKNHLTDAPVLLMGDLNSLPTYPVLIHLQTSLTDKLITTEVPTYYHQKSHKKVQIDYIFGRGIVETKLYTTQSDASDHTPLILIFDIGELPYMDSIQGDLLHQL